MAGWLVAAVASTAISWSAVSVVRGAVAPARSAPLSEAEPDGESPAPTASATSGGPSATSAAPPASTGSTDRIGRKITEGGTVTARCTSGGALTLVNATPRQGFTADLDDAPAEVKFTSDDHRTEIGIGCTSGEPRFSVEEDDRGDNSGPGGGGDDGSNSGPGG